MVPCKVFCAGIEAAPLSLSISLSLSLSLALSPSLSLPRSLSLALSIFLLSLSLSLSPRFSLSSFCLIVFSLVAVSRVVCGVRAARCQSRRVLGVSRVVRSHRVVRSLASSPLLSSRVVCRRVVRSLASSPRLSSRVVCRSHRVVRSLAHRLVCRLVSCVLSSCVVPLLVSCVLSSCVVPLLGVSRVVCGVLPPSSVSLRCAQSPRRQESRVIRSSVVLRRVSSRRASSPCSASDGLCARRVSRVPFSFSDPMDDVFFRIVLTPRVFFLS